MAVFRRDPPLQPARLSNPALLGPGASTAPLIAQVRALARDSAAPLQPQRGMAAILGTPAIPLLVPIMRASPQTRDPGPLLVLPEPMGAVLGTPPLPPLFKGAARPSLRETFVLEPVVDFVAPFAGTVAPSAPIFARGPVTVPAQSWVYPWTQTGASELLLSLGRIGGGTAGAWSARAWSPRAWYTRAWYKGTGIGVQPSPLPLPQVRWQEPWRFPTVQIVRIYQGTPLGSPAKGPPLARTAPIDGRFTALKRNELQIGMFTPDAPPRAGSVTQPQFPASLVMQPQRVTVLQPTVQSQDVPPGMPPLMRVAPEARALTQLQRVLVLALPPVSAPPAPPPVLQLQAAPAVLWPQVRVRLVQGIASTPDAPPGAPVVLQVRGLEAARVQPGTVRLLPTPPAPDAPTGGSPLPVAAYDRRVALLPLVTEQVAPLFGLDVPTLQPSVLAFHVREAWRPALPGSRVLPSTPAFLAAVPVVTVPSARDAGTQQPDRLLRRVTSLEQAYLAPPVLARTARYEYALRWTNPANGAAFFATVLVPTPTAERTVYASISIRVVHAEASDRSILADMTNRTTH